MAASTHGYSRHQQPAIHPSPPLIPLPTPPAEACCIRPPYRSDHDWPTPSMLSPPNSSNSSSSCCPSSSSACPPAPFSSSSCCSPRLTPSVSNSTCNTPGPSSPTTSDDQVPTTLIRNMTLAEIECCIIESVMKEGMDSTCCQDLIPPGTVFSRSSRYEPISSCSIVPSSRREESNTSACSTNTEMKDSGGCCEDASNSPCSPTPTVYALPATTPTISAALTITTTTTTTTTTTATTTTAAAAATQAIAEASATVSAATKAADKAVEAAGSAGQAAVAMATSGTGPMPVSEYSPPSGTENSTWEMDPVHPPTTTNISALPTNTQCCSPSYSPCATSASTGHDARKPSRFRPSGCEPPSPFQAQQGVRCSPTSPPCSSSFTSNAFDSAVSMNRPTNVNIGPDPAVTMGCAAIAGMSSSASSLPFSHPVSERSHAVFQPLYLNNPSSARDPLQDRPPSNHHHSRSSVSSPFLPLSPDSTTMDEGHRLLPCQWYGCSAEFVSPAELWSHLSELHVSLQEICFPTLCQWESCLAQQPNHDGLLWHLRMEHHIIPPTTPAWPQMIPMSTPHSPHAIQHQHQHEHPQHQENSTPRSFQYPPYQEELQQQHQQQQQHYHHHQQQQQPVVMSQHRHSYSSVSTTGSISGSILASEMPHMSLSGLSSPNEILGDAHHERAAWGTSSPETSPFVTIKQEEEAHSLLSPQQHEHSQQQHQHQHQQHYFSQHTSALTPLQEQLLQQSHHHPCLWGDCRQAFPSFDTLTSHLSEEHIGMGKSEYVCEWINCDRRGRGFGQRQKAMRHIQTHTGDKPFQCQVCQKRFSEANIMAQHMRTHTGEKPFRCDEPGCGRQFSISGALTIHRRVHTGEKPFKCKFQGCDKWFAESSNLTKHLRVHTGERPFQCPFVGCDKRFSRPDQVTRHKKTHMTDAEKLAVLKAEKMVELRRR